MKLQITSDLEDVFIFFMNNWILEKFFDHQNQPNPKFAFLGTVFSDEILSNTC